ncbi:hypothetical protein MPSEU_000520200 [Mayamaea pseudoterrestris]|nr:hypothetical protein MPSEU_000520200 [Mayamaea pseudoterrestris]
MATAHPPIPRQLFGGAVQVSLPIQYQDLALIRQVPDNQECWLDSARDALFVLECLEHDASLNFQEAARNSWIDLCNINESKQEDMEFTFAIDTGTVRGLPESAIIGCGYGFQRVKMGRAVDINEIPRQQEERRVQVEICVIRLPSVATDLLLTLSTPCCLNQQENGDHAYSATFQTILSSLEIKDWRLFG